jgi:small subunit ribosomal protein S20
MRVSRIRTFVKKVESLLAEGNQSEVVVALREAESEIMRGVSKGVIHKNTASRKVSRLSKRVKALGAA